MDICWIFGFSILYSFFRLKSFLLVSLNLFFEEGPLQIVDRVLSRSIQPVYIDMSYEIHEECEGYDPIVLAEDYEDYECDEVYEG